MFVKICKSMGMEAISEYRFHSKRRWRNDFFFPEASLAVEINGGAWMDKSRHFYGKGAINDMEKTNAMTEEGIWLLTFQPDKIDYDMIKRVYDKLTGVKV